MPLLALLFFTSHAVTACQTDIDCSLNGVCNNGNCVCDKPWGGPGCGVLQYKKNQSILAKNLYPHNDTDAPSSGPCVTPKHVCDALDTWNGPIVKVGDKYHMFNPLYRKGSLLSTQDMMHGVADEIEGPYAWKSMGNMGSNPAFVMFNDPDTGKTKYSLWFAGDVVVSDNIDGPYTKVGPSPGGNPAPIYHNGTWYATTQGTREVVTTTRLGKSWTKFADIKPHTTHGIQEDPFMYIDQKGNWHIINHAYDTSEYQNCGKSLVSAHVYSPDGKNWHMLDPNVQPYSHTVHYEDGTSHTYTTLERPSCHFNEAGQMTHINLAADLMTQDGGCVNYAKCPAKKDGHCACTNCKYADHAGAIIIALDV